MHGFSGIPGRPAFVRTPGRPGRGGWSSEDPEEYFGRLRGSTFRPAGFLVDVLRFDQALRQLVAPVVSRHVNTPHLRSQTGQHHLEEVRD